MKKFKIIGVFIIFIISFISHFLYDIYPNFIFSILFPVNESIWEHMKLIVTPTFIYNIFEYLIFKKKNIEYNNFLLANSISVIIGIIFYLIIYLPIDYLFGHNFLFAIILLFFTFVLVQYINYKIINYKKINNSCLIGFILILLIYLVFGYLTYNPIKNDLFYDKVTNTYGI